MDDERDMNRLPADIRYLRDPHFAVLVDTLTAQISQGNYTPTELREAVTLAATRFELLRPARPFLVDVHQRPPVGHWDADDDPRRRTGR